MTIDEDSDGLKPILFYHGGCPDGFGAAFAFWLKYQDEIEYIPMYHFKKPYHGIDPILFHNRKIWIADISLNREDLISAHRMAKELTVLDHHAGNMEQLSDLDFCYFDMNHSGAILAWQYVFPNQPPPKLLLYIEDRDLHNQKLPYAQELLSAVDANERNFASWDTLCKKIEDPIGFAELLEEGSVILKYNKLLMKSLKKKMYKTEIKGYTVPVINTPFFRNEILNDFAIGEPFSAAYHYDGESFVFSLRSSKTGVNVLEIAEQFEGGGGHIRASGFSIKSLDELKK